MYTYEITSDFKVNVYGPNGDLVNWPGPWQNEEEARQWAEVEIERLNSIEITNEDSE